MQGKPESSVGTKSRQSQGWLTQHPKKQDYGRIDRLVYELSPEGDDKWVDRG